MTLEKFKRIINIIYAVDSFIDKAEKLGINMIESPIYDSIGALETELFTTVYGEEGCDLIMEFLYKNENLHEATGVDNDGNSFSLERIDELWEYLEKNCIK